MIGEAKVPFAIGIKDDSPFVFAGLWEGWRIPSTGEWLRTCTIITCDANELVSRIHPRMPVILPVEHHSVWLGETEDGDLKALLRPYPADEMKMWPVSERLNSLKHDDPTLLDPIG